MKLNKVEPEFISKSNPRIGLITLGSDFRIEKDFNNLIYGRDIDLYVNRIHCYNPLTNETLAKMADDITEVAKDILPDQKIDCVAYGCTSGTVAAGYDKIKSKINLAKPEARVTTPITAAVKAINKLSINKISIFTPYTKTINDSVVKYFKEQNIIINSLTYFDIESDLDIGKVDENYLFNVLVNDWPQVYGTSSILVKRKVLNKFFDEANPFNWKYLAIDIQLAIYCKFNFKVSRSLENITKKTIHNKNLGDKYLNLFRKNFWRRRFMQHEYNFFIKKKSKLNLDYIFTKFINYFFRKL